MTWSAPSTMVHRQKPSSASCRRWRAVSSSYTDNSAALPPWNSMTSGSAKIRCQVKASS
ncbi:hypothetical protein SHIRM173S_07749 [Streptomyces hirsutus]